MPVDIDEATLVLKPGTKGDKQLAEKLLKENTALAVTMHELLLEKQKLLLEVVKKIQPNGDDVEALAREQEELKQQIELLRRQIEQIKKGAVDKVPTPK